MYPVGRGERPQFEKAEGRMRREEGGAERRTSNIERRSERWKTLRRQVSAGI